MMDVEEGDSEDIDVTCMPDTVNGAVGTIVVISVARGPFVPVEVNGTNVCPPGIGRFAIGSVCSWI